MGYRRETYKNGVRIETVDTRTLEEVKAEKIALVKDQAGKRLSKSDWRIVKAMDTGIPVPSEIAQERAKIRSKSDELENIINNATELIQLDRLPVEDEIDKV